MTDVDPLSHVSRSRYMVSVDYPAIIAAMTSTAAGDWTEVDGPESGVGVDYHFAHPRGVSAYAQLHQEVVSINVTEADGSAGATLDLELPAQPED